MLFQKKKDGSLRLYVEYKGINKSTANDKYPLPILDKLVDHLSRAKKFSKINLRIGYNQLLFNF